VTEYLLYGRTDYSEVIEFATTLREAGEKIDNPRAVAFADTVAGEVHLLMGDLESARDALDSAADLHREIGAYAGEAMSLQRLAEVHMQLAENDEALRLLELAIPLARWSAISQHLIQRIYGSMILATRDPDAARAMVDRAEEAIGPSDQCVLCTVMVALPSAIACARVGDIDGAERFLKEGEASAMGWEGTAWQGAVVEARAHLALALGEDADAAEMFVSAADLFGRAGQPLDRQRCLAAAG